MLHGSMEIEKDLKSTDVIVSDPETNIKSVDDGRAEELTFDIGVFKHIAQDKRNQTTSFEYYEYCREVYNTFLYKLRRYTDDDQQLVEILDTNGRELPDDMRKEYPMTGIISTMRIKLQSNIQCFLGTSST